LPLNYLTVCAVWSAVLLTLGINSSWMNESMQTCRVKWKKLTVRARRSLYFHFKVLYMSHNAKQCRHTLTARSDNTRKMNGNQWDARSLRRGESELDNLKL
jgi:hypothetical protein